MHPQYEQLIEKARSSHEQSRSSRDISRDDIAAARLYCYAFRMHTIGAFHATRLAVKASQPSDVLAQVHLKRAAETLEDLLNQGMEGVPDDFRVVISAFHRYDRGVRRVRDALDNAYRASRDEQIDHIGKRFDQIMDKISGSNGLVLTRDTEAPEQASFIVPNLGIMIVPLVYGDHHSWNLAFLSEQHLDVPMHQHARGVEIHLGYAPLGGHMVLGECKSPVDEGYALPIPPMTRHGWANLTGRAHHVPFIFGSLEQAGWGVFLDVEPQPKPVDELMTVKRTDWQMSATVFLERQIEIMTKLKSSRRQQLIPYSATNRDGSGGLELSIARVTTAGLALPRDTFRIVTVVSGEGLASVGPAERHVEKHDHFGIPAGMRAQLQQEGNEPMVVLDAMIRK